LGISAISTASTSPSPSVTSGAGWLQVTPTSVQLGCDSGQQSQVVVLANTGQESVQWQAELSVASDQAGVSISPRHGTLRPGTSIAIHLQNASNGESRQGVVSFTTDAPAAGTPPTLTYTTTACS
jgi:hypothetical protein